MWYLLGHIPIWYWIILMSTRTSAIVVGFPRSIIPCTFFISGLILSHVITYNSYGIYFNQNLHLVLFTFKPSARNILKMIFKCYMWLENLFFLMTKISSIYTFNNLDITKYPVYFRLEYINQSAYIHRERVVYYFTKFSSYHHYVLAFRKNPYIIVSHSDIKCYSSLETFQFLHPIEYSR